MIKRLETLNEKEQVYELICLEVQEELIYKKQTLPHKDFVFETFDDKNEIYFIDMDKETVNGFIRAHAINFVDEMWVYGLYVRENKRKKGIAKSLIEEVIKYAKVNGKESIKLYAYSNNIASLKLYEQYGFREIQKLMIKDL